jgi:predicted nucleotidyltransferase
MKSESSELQERDASIKSAEGLGVTLGLPVQEPELFKHGATSHILNFLADNPDFKLSLRQLARVVPYTERSVREAVDVLEANDLVRTVHEANARRVQINRDRLQNEDDPILSIPQTEFQLPTRIGTLTLEDELDDIRGILLFGSVARGEADRQSDIDLWVLVDDDAMGQQHTANKLSDELSGLQIPPAVALRDASDADIEENWETIREQLENDGQNWASAQRYSFEIIVETPTSFLNQLDRVDTEMFTEGITLRESETFQRCKQEVLDYE